MTTKKHKGRDDLIGEHSFGDGGQVLFIILFLIVYIADSVFGFTTFLNDVVPAGFRILSGIIFLIGGGFLSFSAILIVFGETREKPEVIRKGVFAISRHPVYLGEILMYLALLFFSMSIASAVVWIMAVVFLHYIARYEEKILLDFFGDEYRRYMNEVSMWLPGFSWLFSFILAGLAGTSFISAQTPQHPNVLLIITDDQGYGDFGFTGNPHVKTPCLDRLAAESTWFSNFYVSPVSAPTRSSLMTGRYSLRTGVRDTNNSGAIMASSEITIAEILKKAGYATGHFGKWHLGDNYPSRPIDQGFDESLMHLGGGMGQPGDITTYLRGDSSYFNPVLWHNGLQKSFSGYCSDIFTDQAIRFIEKKRSSPFFCYLAFNAPHTPLQVPEKYYNMYRNIDPSAGFVNDRRPFPGMSEKDKEDARKVYAMVSNIDDNISRVLKRLDELDIRENTVVIFMTDNGPQQRRYIAGMRGLKGTVYRGGVRVPLLIRYPAAGAVSKEIEATAAHIDLLPTIASFCNAPIPGDRKIDGIDLKPLITGSQSELRERTLFFYWTRHSPELYNNIALQMGRFRLIGNTDFNSPISRFELFDVKTDPYERKNIVNDQPQVAEKLKSELDITLRELVTSVNMTEKQYIYVGTANENPVILNRNDADGQWGVWEQEEAYGTWRVIISEGTYNMRFRFIRPLPVGGRMMVETGSVINQMKNDIPDTYLLELKNVYLNSVKCDFTPFYLHGGKRILPLWVEIEKIK